VTQPQWEGPSLEITDQGQAAAIGCLRISAWLRRIGLDSAWRFIPGEGESFHLARVLLTGGSDITVEVGFAAEDLALAATDPEAVSELARQAVANWRARDIR
jgi:hypothetical protein